MKRIIEISIFLFYISVLSDVLGQSGMYRASGGVKIPGYSLYDNSEFVSLYQSDTISPTNDSIIFRKYDKNGNLIFKKLYKGFSNSYTWQFLKSKDNGYIAIFDVGPLSNYAIIKFDYNGNLIWKKALPNEFDNTLKVYSNTIGQLYLIDYSNRPATSFKSENSYGQDDIWVVKLDINGNKIWDKVYGGVDNESFYNALYVNDNRLVIFGSSVSDNSGNKTSRKQFSGNINYEPWILELDSNGSIKKDIMMLADINSFYSGFYNSTITPEKGFLCELNYSSSGSTTKKLIRLDGNYNILWQKSDNIAYGIISFANDAESDLFAAQYSNGEIILRKIDADGNVLWSQTIADSSGIVRFYKLYYDGKSFLFWNWDNLNSFQGVHLLGSPNWIWLDKNRSSISGRVFPDFNADCNFNKPNEYNIPKCIVRNKTENTYAITNDSTYTMYLFQKDTAVLEIVNLDGSLYTSCGKNNIIIDMKGKVDITGIDFPIRSSKAGHCMYVTSFSSGLLRPGRWGDYQLNYQNNAFDTAYNAYIEIELDMSTIDSIVSPYVFSQIGNILKFNLGHIKPFGYGALSYSIKLKTSVVIGSSQCHRSKIFPDCSLYPSNGYDGSDIKASLKCLGNNTIELELENAGSQNQTQKGRLAIYQDESLMKQDSFKMDKGTSSKFQYQLDDNKVFTAEVYSSNAHPVTPILIRHQDLCANKRPIISNNPVVNFYRHDEAKEYEEYCQIVQGSYDPNVKSVQPSGFLSEHYTANGTELKYRIDFQNTGTDTAFRVFLIDTLSPLLNIATFMPGVSSHPYSIEFGGRAVKFIFDPIALVDSFKNEPLSHGYVHFKIKPIAGINPKTKIENKADIYFDYNAPIRTNTVFNTILDTIQIYVPKGGSAIAENDKTSVIVFPNPSTDKFFIQMSEPVKDLSIEIYDMQGRLIKTASSSNNQTVEVSVEGMTKGIYHIRCMSGEKLIVVKKVMVE
jgi:uncharacterized repeat protein (TIGR01451 family)